MITSSSQRFRFLKSMLYLWCLPLLICVSYSALGQEPQDKPRADASPTPESQELTRQEWLRKEIGDVEQAAVLSLGQLIERDLKATEKHLYKINIRAGQYLRVDVNQRGIDVRLTLASISDTKVISVDAKKGNSGRESLSFVAETDGDVF